MPVPSKVSLPVLYFFLFAERSTVIIPSVQTYRGGTIILTQDAQDRFDGKRYFIFILFAHLPV